MTAVYPHEVTGFPAAADVLQRVGGVLLSPDAAAALALALIGTVEPYIKADVLADLADDLLAEALRWAELPLAPRCCAPRGVALPAGRSLQWRWRAWPSPVEHLAVGGR